MKLATADAGSLRDLAYSLRVLDALTGGDLAQLVDTSIEGPSPARIVTLSAAQFAILERAKRAIAASDGQTEPDETLTDARTIELVCAEYLAGA